MVIALPLPSTRICEGLATAIKALLQENDIEVYLMFLRGSRRRLEALRHHHCHGVVLSSFAARDMCGPNERRILELPPYTYIREHRVFVRDGLREGTKRSIRVAIDRDSADLQRLAELEFQGKNVEFVPATFMQFGQLLESGQVDAIVWDVDEAKGKLPPTVHSRPLSEKVHQFIGNANTQANLVARSDDDVFVTVTERCLDTSRLLEIQQGFWPANESQAIEAYRGSPRSPTLAVAAAGPAHIQRCRRCRIW